ncbi:hypothetical protein AB2881_31055, partial [Escherichia coli]
MIAIETFREAATGHNNRSEKQKTLRNGRAFLTSDFDLGTELDNPVWRDLKLIRRPQGVTL